MYDLESPDITHTLETGYPTETVWPHCPVCGRECEEVYKHDGDVIGCEQCIHIADAWETDECFPERNI